VECYDWEQKSILLLWLLLDDVLSTLSNFSTFSKFLTFFFNLFVDFLLLFKTIVSPYKWVSTGYFSTLNITFEPKFQKPNCFKICQHATSKIWFLTIWLFYAFKSFIPPLRAKIEQSPNKNKTLVQMCTKIDFFCPLIIQKYLFLSVLNA